MFTDYCLAKQFQGARLVYGPVSRKFRSVGICSLPFEKNPRGGTLRLLPFLIFRQRGRMQHGGCAHEGNGFCWR